MTGDRPQKPQPPSRPNRPGGSSSSMPSVASKPYELISFPKERPALQRPAGHHKYLGDRLHGTVFLTLKVQTSVHVSTGVVVMGSDVGNNRIPLIKTMVQGVDQISIQGSSLKGCIRSVYEAITNSTLAVITSKYRSYIPTERLPCRQKEQLCPVSQVFGALDWQGLIDFSDAKCEGTSFAIGFMPSLYPPRPDQCKAYFIQGKVAGRKFYYHTLRAIDKGQNAGVAVQQAGKEYSFTTQLNFMNLKPEELGTLLVVLGQDSKEAIALKVGGGKPIGMGTIIVQVTKMEVLQNSQELRDRYSRYTLGDADFLTGEPLRQFMLHQIQAAHSRLIQAPQLQQLANVLRYPTARQPRSEMY